jgi:putative tryptophan/tyrosine transport system substrate-binding protein
VTADVRETTGRPPGKIVKSTIGKTFGATAGAVLVLWLLFAPLITDAQQAGKVPRIGVLWGYSPSDVSRFGEAFRQGLASLGYVEGQNIVLQERWSEGQADRLPSLAAELVRLNIDVIVAASTPAARAARQATKTIPIVLTLVTDPVGDGFAASLARPGGNVTGLSMMHPELSGTRLALLKDIVPKASRVAVLRSPSTPLYEQLLRETEVAARTLGVQLQVVVVRDPAEFDNAFATLTRDHAQALLWLPDPMFRNHLRRILDLTAKSRLPALYWSKEPVEAGGLVSYGANIPEMYRHAAIFVDKILKGAKPADLPVEQPTTFELVINLKTAQALGLTIPPMLLFQATEVIR